MASEKRLIVCYTSTAFHPVYTGAGIRFRRYAPGFAERGIELTVFTRVPEKTHSSFEHYRDQVNGGKFLPVETVDGLKVQRVNLPSETGTGLQNQMAFIRAFVEYCRNSETRPDVIQTTYLSDFWLPWLVMLRRMGIPHVYWHSLLAPLSSSPVKRQRQKLLWRLKYQLPDCVVASSTAARTSLQQLGVTNRIEVIPNGVDLDQFQPVDSTEKARLRQELNLPAESEIILFVGGLIQRKGIDLLLEAWRDIASRRPEAHLVLVGPSYKDISGDAETPEFRQKIERALAECGAEDRIVFAGTVSNVQAYFQAADLFVFPARREGMGNVVLEAFGCGLASILTPFLGFPYEEFGTRGREYLLVEHEPAAIAEATVSLLENPTHRQSMGQQARRWVEAHMSIDDSIAKCAAIYRELTRRS